MHKLEIVAMSEHLNYRLGLLQETFSSLKFLVKSDLFVTFGCMLPHPLTEDEKTVLEQYIANGVIRCYRCKKAKE